MTGKNITFRMILSCQRVALVGLGLALFSLPIGTRSRAADPLPITSNSVQFPPLDLDALKPGRTPPSVVTATTISQFGLTVPSLWWIREQIAAVEAFGGKLLRNWLAYPRSDSGIGRVDLVVNRQLWSLMDYLQRYEVIHRFSTAARDFGYNVRVFDDRANFLGAYICDFRIAKLEKAVISQSEPPPTCNLVLDAGGKAGLRGGSNPFDGSSPIVPDTGLP